MLILKHRLSFLKNLCINKHYNERRVQKFATTKRVAINRRTGNSLAKIKFKKKTNNDLQYTT